MIVKKKNQPEIKIVTAKILKIYFGLLQLHHPQRSLSRLCGHQNQTCCNLFQPKCK